MQRQVYLKWHYNNNPVVDGLAEQLEKETRNMNEVEAARYVIEILEDHFQYIYDWREEKVENYTPYVVPMRPKSFEVMKAPTQMFIDGGGDCDDYAAIATLILAKMGIQTYYVGADGHAVIALRVTKKPGCRYFVFDKGHLEGGYVVLLEPQNRNKTLDWHDLGVERLLDAKGNVVWP